MWVFLFYFIFESKKKVNFERSDIEKIKLICIKIQIL